MNKGLRTGLIIGAVVVAIWLVSVIGVTLIRSNCLRPLTERCNNGLLQAYGDIVQLGWVKDYQTLISGILALLAGTFVYVAARHQSRDLNRRERELQRRTTMGTIAAVRAQFVKYRADLFALREPSFSYPKALNYSTDATRDQTGQLGGENSLLVDYISAALVPIDRAFQSRSGSLGMRGRRPIEAGLACAIAMSYYLRNPANLVDDDGAYNRQIVDGDALLDQLDNAGCLWNDLPGAIRQLFSAPEFERDR